MIQIDVAGVAPNTGVWLKKLTLADNTTTADALTRLGLSETTETAVFNERVTGEYVLKTGDRLDVLSPLCVDPMQARRDRLAKKSVPVEPFRGRHGGKHRLLGT